ncbi:glycoside hydrolase family 2 TIM barrel-domain containing protein [Bosea sp. BK604]|uniref:glycoside hydrolase family 2 protein n=1 Tax=Bosea sp. BK604 TaxID=2512180 RepID=UPI0010515A04|nr:glycoside hydrolase family 2 TIM barrel-domain containing protein [Bosea sp. BK604]TCR69617.1 beta-glucuronidase [Bosea sp. BK604]
MGKAAIDPFAHLHDEGYADGFAAGYVTAATLVQGGGRPVESLAGPWRMTLDLFDEGLRQKWYAEDDTPPSQWPTPRDYEIEAGELVQVPSCWNLLKPEWTYFEGAAWYTRDLDWRSGASGERAFLQIAGANYSLLVFVNGRFVGGHRGGSTPCSLELTQALEPGSNRLQIMVENRRRADRVPMHHFDWFNYGGLYREVELLRLPATFIRQAAIALVPGSGFRAIAMTVKLSDPVDGSAVITIPELGVEASVAITAGEGRLTLEAAPQLWSPASPKLYEVEIRHGADLWRDRVGFREIRTEGTTILLNGEPIFLAGACVHEDDVTLGKTSNEADIRRRIRHARELGANFLRLAHYPHHELVALIADEEGLLLWAEIPVYWAIDFGNAETYADAENQLLELVARDINRASIVMWGVGNENADTDERYRFMAGLATRARLADPTRLVAAACLINRERFAIEDRLADHLDVIGINEYFGWYEPDVANLERLVANSDPGKPVVISETGADALFGHRGAGRVLFSEDWQAEFYRLQMAVIARTPWIRGMAAWLLYDFRSERRQTGFQRGFNRKGLIAEDKTTKKAAFAVLAELYRNQG